MDASSVASDLQQQQQEDEAMCLERSTRKLLAESFVILLDGSSSSRAHQTRLLKRLVGTHCVLQDMSDIRRMVASHAGVDIIVVDLDPATVKLLDWLRERSLSDSKLAVIPVLVIVNPDNPQVEMLQTALDAGAADCLYRPLTEATWVHRVGQVLRRKVEVENVYRDLQRGEVEEVKLLKIPRFHLDGFDMDTEPKVSNSATLKSRDSLIQLVPKTTSVVPPSKGDEEIVQPARIGDKKSRSSGRAKGRMKTTAQTVMSLTQLGGGASSAVDITSALRRPRLYRAVPSSGGGGAAAGLSAAARVVSAELRPFVWRSRPEQRSPRACNGMSRSRVAKLRGLMEITLPFSQGQSTKEAWARNEGVLYEADAKTFNKSEQSGDENVSPTVTRDRGLVNRLKDKEKNPVVTANVTDICRTILCDGQTRPRPLGTNSAVHHAKEKFCAVRDNKRKAINNEQHGQETRDNLFRIVVSSMAKNVLHEGLGELVQRPDDVLAADFIHPPSTTGTTPASTATSVFMKKLRGRDFDGALQLCRKAVQAEPTNIRCIMNKAVANARAGEPFDALTDFAQALRLCQQRPMTCEKDLVGTIHFNRAIVYTMLGDDVKALLDLNEAVKRDPRCHRYRSHRALLRRRCDDFTAAGKDYQRLLVQAELDRRTLQAEQKELEGPRLEEGQGECRRENIKRTKANVAGDAGLLQGRPSGNAIPERVPQSFDPTYGQSFEEISSIIVQTPTLVAGKLRSVDGEKDPTLTNYKDALHPTMKDEVFEELFCKPLPLHEALTLGPEQRSGEHVATIAKYIKVLPQFYKLPPAEVNRIAAHIEYRVLQAGSPIFRQGKTPEAMAVILSGEVQIRMRRHDKMVAELRALGAEESFGEDTLLMSTAKDLPYAETRLVQGYRATRATELLLVLAEDFHNAKHLVQQCRHRLRKKFLALRRCRCFDTWPRDDIMRLAIMSHLTTFPLESVMMEQGEEAQELHVLLMGIARVVKYPDRSAQVQRKLADLQAEVARIREKYVYHHSLRHTQSRVSAHESARQLGLPSSMLKSETHLCEMQEKLDASYTTNTEVRLVQLQRQITRLEHRLSSIRRTDGDTVDADKVHMVAHLTCGDIFGERAVSAVEGSVALGSVVAESVVETLAIHKIALQTFAITEDFVNAVRQKATFYPEDIKLAEAIEAERAWTEGRRLLVVDILTGPQAGDRRTKNQQILRDKPLCKPDIRLKKRRTPGVVPAS